MNQAEIIAMAKEARISEMGLNIDGSIHLLGLFERFAALVASKERESVAQLIETTEWWKAPKWQSALCPITKGAIADAIRARGQKEGV